MSLPRIAEVLICCVMAAALGCKSAAKSDQAAPPAELAPDKTAQIEAPPAECAKPGRIECPTKKGKLCDGSEDCLKRGKECPKANYPGTIAKHKMQALMEATKTHSLLQIRAAAKALADAMAKHTPADEKLAEQESYVELQTAAMAAIKKVGAQRSTMDATRAAQAIAATCAECHRAYQ